MKKQNLKYIWFSWAITFPLLFIAAFQLMPFNQEIEIETACILLAFIFIVAIMPLTIENNTITFTMGLSLFMFLAYGLFAEIIATQIGLCFTYLRLNITKKTLYRIPLNSLVFIIVSTLSAVSFHLAGGEIGPTTQHQMIGNLVPIGVYVIVNFIANQAIIYFIGLFLLKNKPKLFSRDFFWDLNVSLIIFPVGLSLYYMIQKNGDYPIVYTGISYIILMIILNLLSESKMLNNYLQRTMHIGQAMSWKMEEDKVIDEFFEQLTRITSVSNGFLFFEKDGELKLKRFFVNSEEGFRHSTPKFTLFNDTVSEKVFKNKKEIIYHKRSNWFTTSHSNYVDAESVLSVPIIKNQEVVGVLTICSERKKAYKRYQMVLVELLATYLVTAVENARYYNETKKRSEIDSLTGLYNYQYLENDIKTEFLRLSNNEIESLSFILLDLDHFKKVNDNYGHQAGNEVLIEVGKRLKNVVKDKGMVARFGGEEFSILLLNKNENETFAIAEAIRSSLERLPFSVRNYMSNEQYMMNLRITASIGAAVAPLHADDPNDLIRCADRAMYSDAKNAGRNRVAIYKG
ncbi:diguanylate cyclase [Bacillus sp. RG28]|uniref:Diguanylate cyclase n=1 Tax=Gottfriedia endophytica TaxID=2820819 RepID=A0A940NLZ6_9BACI|nr:sensor domain-containing diguanylate cyclase [Gottfriedia endophytica]MBP0723893.1 diguanylate cyclase [Gottfriedia endophytica]